MQPKAIVESFCEAWTRLDFDGVIDHLHADICYHNIPLEPIHGLGSVRDYLRSAWRFSACEWRLVQCVAEGPIVMTERVDDFIINGHSVTLPVMGIFEISDNRILHWRDYFDLLPYRAQIEAATK